ncbi:hypothetical protein [Neorhodopirellula pilleata]|nr:hypothetical protein [Neorhodopirellula pilleata]
MPLPTDNPLTVDSDVEPANETLADQFRRDAERLETRLAALHKPAGQLTLVPDVLAIDDSVEPVNQAAVIFASESPQRISAQWPPIVKAERVHVPFCHRPTYFQELNLERCGRIDCQSMGCLQNAYSSFWFLSNAALLPYRSVTQSPCQCVSAYGDCTTCQQYPIPIEPLDSQGERSDCTRGMLMQAASMAGFAFLVF